MKAIIHKYQNCVGWERSFRVVEYETASDLIAELSEILGDNWESDYFPVDDDGNRVQSQYEENPGLPALEPTVNDVFAASWSDWGYCEDYCTSERAAEYFRENNLDPKGDYKAGSRSLAYQECL